MSEANAQDTNTDENKPPPIEETARSQGWKPKDEYEGDPDRWVDAREYVLRGEFIDRIKSQDSQLRAHKKEISELKQGYTDYKKHMEQLTQAQIKSKLEELKAAKKVAIENNDVDAQLEADEHILDLKTQQQTARSEENTANQQDPPLDPEVQRWVDENQDWYGTDLAKTGAADRIANSLSEANPTWTPTQVLTETKSQVEKAFGKPKPAMQPGGNAPSQRGGGNNANGKFTASMLSEDQKAIGKRFVSAGALKNLDEYAKQLGEIGEI